MDHLFLTFLALLAVSALLASIAIWAPRRVSIRVAAVATTALFIPLTYLGLTEILSQPKPMAHEWFKRHVDEATVLGVSVREGEAIYLWLRLDDSLEPRYYVLPWRRELAEKLQNLVDEAIRENGTLKFENPFARESYDNLGEYNFQIILPPRPPMKAPPPPPGFYIPRERSASRGPLPGPPHRAGEGTASLPQSFAFCLNAGSAGRSAASPIQSSSAAS